MTGPTLSTEKTPATISLAREQRVTELDALRGLAALSVFWGHAIGMIPHPPGWLISAGRTPLHFVYDGAAAVFLFFVLSGFVLNLRYVAAADSPRGWAGSFIIRRLFRIYPAYWAAVILALLLRVGMARPDLLKAFSDWFSGFWTMPLPWTQVARCLTLIGPGIDPNPLDPPIWSLVVEMRISLIFPLIIWLINGSRKQAWDLLLLPALYVACFALARFAGFFHYLPHFLLGAMCAKYFKNLRQWCTSLNVAAKVVLVALALLLYETRAMAEHLGGDWKLSFALNQTVGLGAALLILLSASLPAASRILRSRVCQFLGRTSYSFYLVHLPVLMALGPWLYRSTSSFWVTWLICLGVAYLLSDLLFRFVETPGMNYGAQLARAFARRLATNPPAWTQPLGFARISKRE